MFKVEDSILNVHNKRELSFENIKFGVGLYVCRGDNGVGKTTFFSQIYNCQLESYSNEQRITLENRSNYIAYATQNDLMLRELTATEIIDLIVTNKSIAYNYCKQLNIEYLVNSKKSYSTFSGGEKQKIKIICNLSSEASILLLDEIDNNLDIETINVIIGLLSELKRDKCILLISHNYEFYDSITDAYLEFEEDKINAKYIGLKNENVLNSFEEKKLEKEYSPLSKYFQQLYILLLASFGLLMVVFYIFVFNMSFYTFLGVTDDIPYSPTSTVVLSPINSPFFDSLGDESWLKKTPLLFDEEIKQVLESQPYVSTVKSIPNLIKSDNKATYIYDGRDYDLKTKEIPIDTEAIPSDVQSKLGDEEIQLSSIASLSFSEQYYTYDVFENTPFVSAETLLWGDFPEDNTNQVLVPVELAVYAIQNNMVDNVDDLIGKSFDITLNEVEGIKPIGEQQFKFKVSGIYYRSGQDAEILYSYSQDNPVAQANDCSLSDNDAIYYSCTYDGAAIQYSDTQYAKLKDRQQLGKYNGFYVEVNSEDDLDKLTNDISKYDPNIYVDNLYVRTTGALNKVVSGKLQSLAMRIVIYLTAAFIIIYLLTKYHANKYIEVDKFINHFNLSTPNYLEFKKNQYFKAHVVMSFVIALSYFYCLYKIIVIGIQISGGLSYKNIALVTVMYMIILVFSNICLKIVKNRFD